MIRNRFNGQYIFYRLWDLGFRKQSNLILHRDDDPTEIHLNNPTEGYVSFSRRSVGSRNYLSRSYAGVCLLLDEYEEGGKDEIPLVDFAEGFFQMVAA